MAVCNNELYMLDGLHDVICKYDFSLNQWEGVHCVSSPGVQHEQLITLDNYITYRGGSQFLVSSDSGLTWYTPANIGFPTGKLPRSVSIVNGVWFATTTNIGGLYYSFDHGDNWLQYNIPINLVITSYGDEVVTALNGNLYFQRNSY